MVTRRKLVVRGSIYLEDKDNEWYVFRGCYYVQTRLKRQPQALARALFAKCDILLLDDTFSGLDGKTEQIIFNNLFGTSGLIKRLKTTVVLVSNSCKLPLVDYQVK